MTRTATRLLLLALACAVAITVALGVRGLRNSPDATPRDTTLRASMRSEPVTFNRLMAQDTASLVIGQLVHATLVRINHETHDVEPYLAARWDLSGDGRTLTLTLHADARFSDGEAVTADDVAFSFEAAYDPRVRSPLGSSLRVAGEPLGVRVVDARTIELTYPVPYGPGLRPLHGLPILPRRHLAAALADGTLGQAWGLDAPPESIVGAGPFEIERYEPGVATTLRRNRHAWQRAIDGTLLPRMDRVIVRSVPSQDSEILQLVNGDLDVTTGELRPEDVPVARQLADEGRLLLFDLGVSLGADLLWFNLAPEASATRDRPWLRDQALREAIAHAVDREAFIDLVYQGVGDAVTGLVTPGNRRWHAADITPRPHSVARAAELLDAIGLRADGPDGMRQDAGNRPARFTVLVQQGHSSRQRAMTVVQQMLRAIGLQMDIVALDPAGLFDRLQSSSYDAIYHALPATDTDPAGLMEFWLSSGVFHVWRPRQPSPATAWEAEIDDLMRAQLLTRDEEERRRLVIRAQHVFDRALPAIFFAAPRVHVATSGRLSHVRPGLLQPPVLWNVAEIGVR
jgi:peptide/nickel transport system substrate-binding protein